MTERYELVGPLGTGGMAEVLLARRVGPNGIERLLAVKRIRPDLAHDPDLVRMLLDEARNAASLVHQRIVQVFDIELRDGVLMYAMEYLHGRTLDDVLSRRSRLPLDAAIAIAIAIADGLHYAHTRAIVHRDVAPSNVMITHDGSIKLIDFGIAKAAGNLSNTVFGTFKGRLGYSSPEQCRCEPTDARSDVYSLAVLLYEMTTGARAFTAATENDMLAVMTAARIAAPTSIDPQFPRDLEAILLQGLAPDRGARHATAQAMQHDLEAFARAHALNLSDGFLSRLMHELFAAELATWLDARSTGLTLEDHVLQTVARTTIEDARRPPAELDASVERNAVDRTSRALPPRRDRRSRPAWVRVALVVVMIVAAFVVTRVLLRAG